MDSTEFRLHGKEMVDYICDYLETINSKRVISSVEPGYLAPLLPQEAPEKGEEWNAIMQDVDDKIMPGVTHWQHPRFHAYFPSGNSFPSILGDMLSDAIGCIGFSWVMLDLNEVYYPTPCASSQHEIKYLTKIRTLLAASPACTELETIVLDWFAKAINLPPEFIFSAPGSTGGGVLQSSASECILVSMLAARAQAIKHLKKLHGSSDDEDSVFLPKLVAYCSKEAHSCVEKAAMIAFVKLRILEADDKCSLRGQKLSEAIKEDQKKGLHPFFVSTTLGTTSSCAFDNLTEIGQVTKSLPACWLHVDGAYAGSGFICPEFHYLMEGIHYADSFNTNCNKWLLVNFDCSCLWVKDRIKLTSAMVVDPLYLQHENSKLTVDYRHWGVPLSRRFRSLKLWFTLRKYGIEGLQKYIRNHCHLAKEFEKLVLQDSRFEVCNEVTLGLVCFRLKGTDRLNQELLAYINSSGQLHMIPSMVKGKYVIRFCVVYEHSTQKDIEHAWEVIQHHGTTLLEAIKIMVPPTPEVKNPKKLSRRFSFTRSVSREVYERRNSRNSLQDGATPIAVPEDEDIDINDINDLEIVEDVFEQCFKITNEKNKEKDNEIK